MGLAIWFAGLDLVGIAALDWDLWLLDLGLAFILQVCFLRFVLFLLVLFDLCWLSCCVVCLIVLLVERCALPFCGGFCGFVICGDFCLCSSDLIYLCCCWALGLLLLVMLSALDLGWLCWFVDVLMFGSCELVF